MSLRTWAAQRALHHPEKSHMSCQMRPTDTLAAPSESQETLVALRKRIAELEKADKEALARLCRIRELEAEVCQKSPTSP